MYSNVILHMCAHSIMCLTSTSDTSSLSGSVIFFFSSTGVADGWGSSSSSCQTAGQWLEQWIWNWLQTSSFKTTHLLLFLLLAVFTVWAGSHLITGQNTCMLKLNEHILCLNISTMIASLCEAVTIITHQDGWNLERATLRAKLCSWG